MVQRKTLGTRIFTVFLYLLMALLALSCLYPIWYAF